LFFILIESQMPDALDHPFSRAILEGNSHLALLQAKCENHSGEVSSSVKHDLCVRNGVVWRSPFMCRLIQTQAELVANGPPPAALWVVIVQQSPLHGMMDISIRYTSRLQTHALCLLHHLQRQQRCQALAASM